MTANPKMDLLDAITYSQRSPAACSHGLTQSQIDFLTVMNGKRVGAVLLTIEIISEIKMILFPFYSEVHTCFSCHLFSSTAAPFITK